MNIAHPLSAPEKVRAPRVPRLNSLQHRLEHAKDATGRPIALIDELLFLLDDPPAGTTDRWQAGAELCASHGIETSRMAVWRFYRANILAWRREQNPAPAPDPKEIARLQEQIRLLAAQRLLEILHDPQLSPANLIALLQTDNHARKVELARDQFIDRVRIRERVEFRENRQLIEGQARSNAMFQQIYAQSRAVPRPTAK